MAFFDQGLAYESGARYDELIANERKYHMKTKVALGLGYLNALNTVLLGQNIQTNLNGNLTFTTPNPPLADLVTALAATTARINAVTNAQTALDQALTERDTELEVLRAILTNLGAYVQNVSGGDEALIISAGMPTKSGREPIFVGQVENLRLTASNESGEVFADWKRVVGRSIYKVQISLDTGAPVNWAPKLDTTKTKCSLNHDLVSGTKVWVRVKAIGPNNEGPWSDVAWKTVP